LILKAVSCSNEKSLTSTQVQANDKSHVLDALGKAGSEIRNRLGESLSTVQKFDTPLAQDLQFTDIDPIAAESKPLNPWSLAARQEFGPDR
jgi:hypothetical protein